jgi:hypothetical protein
VEEFVLSIRKALAGAAESKRKLLPLAGSGTQRQFTSRNAKRQCKTQERAAEKAEKKEQDFRLLLFAGAALSEKRKLFAGRFFLSFFLENRRAVQQFRRNLGKEAGRNLVFSTGKALAFACAAQIKSFRRAGQADKKEPPLFSQMLLFCC